MKRELIIDCKSGGTRAAVLEDGELVELHLENGEPERQTETLYYGRVQAVRPSVHAAFVEIGQELNAFLPLEDGVKLKSGDMLIVQGVAKQTTQSKGLRVSTRVNLTGQGLVLIPGETGVHISKKVKNSEMRARLAEIGHEICPPDCAVIIRTASENVTAEQLHEEAEVLLKVWQEACQRAKGMVKPGVLIKPEPLAVRLMRDLARNLERVVLNDKAEYDALGQMQQEGRLPRETQIEYADEQKTLLFDAFNLETPIDKALKKRVWLPCGGYLIFDFAEALTVIDVNSGKMVTGKSMEETALRVNLEAVKEIAQQIRLRDVGGIIIADLIDMEKDKNRQLVLSALKDAAKNDRMPVKIEGITRLGLLEMTRKRKGEQLRRALRTTCSVCSGSGELLSEEEIARRALRQARRMALAGQRGPFVICLAEQAAKILQTLSQPENCPQVYAVPMGRYREKFSVMQPGEGEMPEQAVALQKKPLTEE